MTADESRQIGVLSGKIDMLSDSVREFHTRAEPYFARCNQHEQLLTSFLGENARQWEEIKKAQTLAQTVKTSDDVADRVRAATAASSLRTWAVTLACITGVVNVIILLVLHHFHIY